MLANLLLLPDDGTYEMLKHVGDLLTSDVYTYFGTYKGWLYKLITVFHVTSSTRAHIKTTKRHHAVSEMSVRCHNTIHLLVYCLLQISS